MVIFFLFILCCCTEIYDFETSDNCLVAGSYCKADTMFTISAHNCPIGYYCPLNIYDKVECPNNKTTIQEGSSLESDCICKKDYYPIYNGDTCMSCGRNTYKSEIENSECHSCPSYSQTFDEGSKSFDNCICNSNFKKIMANKDSFKCECQKGFEFNNSSKSCKECKFGTYKNSIGNSECLKCSYGLTFKNKDKFRTGCLRYSIIYGSIIAGTIIVIPFIILSIMFCKKRNETNENMILNIYV
ncbi:MAG: hypothetical protein MHPSP_001802 [Paramarteilia canceri]